MNTPTENVKIRKAPHWKKTAHLKSFSFALNDEEYTTLRLNSMKMRGFTHDFHRDLETKIIKVHGKNETTIIQDIKNLFPNAEIKVERVFIPYYGRG